jgi:hypothetical protein
MMCRTVEGDWARAAQARRQRESSSFIAISIISNGTEREEFA